MSTKLPSLSDRYPQLPISECALLIQQLASSTDDKAYRIIEQLFENQPCITYKYEPGQTFWRVRILENGIPFDCVSELLWNPKPELKRANRPGKPMLYVSTHLLTAFAETEANDENSIQTIMLKIAEEQTMQFYFVGELITNLRTGASITLKPEIANAHKGLLKASNPEVANSFLFVDAFASETFNNRECHRLSSIISDYLFNKHPYLDGIIYPSIRRQGGQNLAIRCESFQNKCSIIGSAVAKINQSFGYGFYDMEFDLVAYGMDDSYQFIWASNISNPLEWQEWSQ